MTDPLGKWDRARIEHRTTLERCQNRADHGMPHHAMADRVDLLHIVEDLYGKVEAAEARAREAEEVVWEYHCKVFRCFYAGELLARACPICRRVAERKGEP